jgi:hypothetical protein
MIDYDLLNAVRVPVDQKPTLHNIELASEEGGPVKERLVAAVEAGLVEAREDGTFALTATGEEARDREEERRTRIESDRLRNDPSRRWQL